MVSAQVNLQPDRDSMFPGFERLYPDYKDYCLSVSRRLYALSIETCAYIWWLCHELKPSKVCDLGSGFSSYVLRRYATTCGHHVDFCSVEDDARWRDRTLGFLRRQNLPSGNVFDPETWMAVDDRYDLIVYDFSGGQARNDWMLPAVQHLTVDGVAVLDDAQNVLHHLRMGEVCIETGRTLLDCFHQTVDDVGRYASVAV